MIIKNMDNMYRLLAGFILFLALLTYLADDLKMILSYTVNYLFFLLAIFGITVLLYLITYLVLKGMHRK